MNRIEIPHKNKVVEIPSEIEEMSTRQFIVFISLVLRHISAEISLDDFRQLMTIELLGLKHSPRDHFLSAEDHENAMAEIFRISNLCDSFFEDGQMNGQPSKMFRLSFTRQMIPYYKGYHGPASALQDVTFCEYRMAHSFYTAYITSHSEDDLNRMIAVLYRPVKPLLFLRRYLSSYDGQKRRRLHAKTNPLLMDRRARKIARWPLAVRYAIFLFFSGCEKFLATGSVMVDGRMIDLSTIYDRSNESEASPDVGLIGLLYSLAETKVFGSIEETDNQNIYDVMIRLYQVVRQSRELESKYAHHDTGKHL